MRPLIEDVQEKGNRYFRNNRVVEEKDTYVRKNSTSAVGVDTANIPFFLPKKKTPSQPSSLSSDLILKIKIILQL